MKPLSFSRTVNFGLPTYWSIHKAIYKNAKGLYLVFESRKDFPSNPRYKAFKRLREAKAFVNESWAQAMNNLYRGNLA